MPDLATVVLGVKNRSELDDCLAAEAAGPLSEDEMRSIEALRGGRGHRVPRGGSRRLRALREALASGVWGSAAYMAITTLVAHVLEARPARPRAGRRARVPVRPRHSRRPPEHRDAVLLREDPSAFLHRADEREITAVADPESSSRPTTKRPFRRRLCGVRCTPRRRTDASRGATMAYAGQIINNPVSGERIEFLRTAADTDGELLEFELELDADGRVPGAHVHPEQEERFHVLEGTMRFRLGLRTIVAEAGETVVVPAGRVHRFANAGDEAARARVEVVPALDMEQLLCTTSELAREGNVLRSGMPRPLHLALFVRRFRREVRAPFPPAPVVHALMAPFAALARRRGYDQRYTPIPAFA
jgi:quercetin dioxygenase-like cupin family protein